MSRIHVNVDSSNENITCLQEELDGIATNGNLSEKQFILAGEIAFKMALQGRFEILSDFFDRIREEKLDRFLENEQFLRALIALRFQQERFSEVAKLLKEGRFYNFTGLLELWDGAHYREREKAIGRKLNPLLRFRVRKKNPPPKSICPSGQRPSAKLPEEGKRVLTQWYTNNIKYPYPSQDTKQQLAEKAGLTPYQVKTWFANARRRNKLSAKEGKLGVAKKERQALWSMFRHNGYAPPSMQEVSHTGNGYTPELLGGYLKNNEQLCSGDHLRTTLPQSSVCASHAASGTPFDTFQSSGDFRTVAVPRSADVARPTMKNVASRYSLRELARLCEGVGPYLHPSVTRMSPPHWPSPGVGRWNGDWHAAGYTDVPLQHGDTSLWRNGKYHAPVDVFYQTEEVVAPGYQFYLDTTPPSHPDHTSQTLGSPVYPHNPLLITPEGQAQDQMYNPYLATTAHTTLGSFSQPVPSLPPDPTALITVSEPFSLTYHHDQPVTYQVKEMTEDHVAAMSLLDLSTQSSQSSDEHLN